MQGFRGSIHCLFDLLQITSIADNQVLSVKMDASEKDEQQGHDSSNLTGVEFGPDSGSIFAIDPGTLINLNVNFTNQAEVDDIVNIKINGPENWNISWEYSTDTTLGFNFEIQSGDIEWSEFSITAPITENGLPLANSLHQFTMELNSNLTGTNDWYNFSMKYGYFHGVEIVEGGGTYSISPYDVATIEMTTRNIGNTQRDIGVSIRPVNENGSELGEFSLAFALEEERFHTE